MTPHDYALSLANKGHSAQSILTATGVRLGFSVPRKEYTPQPAPEAVPERPMTHRESIVTQRMKMEADIKEIALDNGITFQEIMGRGKANKYAHPRQEAMFMLYIKWHLSYPRIGKLMRRDHSTVVYGVASYCRRAGIDPDSFRRNYTGYAPTQQDFLAAPKTAKDYVRRVAA